MIEASFEGRIPLIFCVDVEPDQHFFAPTDPSPWEGFEIFGRWLEEYRDRAAEATERPVRYSWFLRMDPQVEVAYGTPSHVVGTHPGDFERMVAHRDALGVHPHMARWEEADRRWVVDHGSPGWVEECVGMSFESYRTTFGLPPVQQRFGAGWWSEDALGLIRRLGSRFDLTAEPGEYKGTPASSSEAEWRGVFPDFRAVPQRPYRLSTTEAIPARAADPETLWEIPLTSGRRVRPSTAVQTSVTRLRHPLRTVRNSLRGARRAMSGGVTPRSTLDLLAMSRPWRTPRDFWGAVERRLAELDLTYLAFATRSDVPLRPRMWKQVRDILDLLLTDPLAERLAFTTPEGALSSLGLLPAAEIA